MINETQLKKYCNEDIRKIENYEKAVNDKTQTWHCHHRLEIQGQFRNSKALLKKCGMYYHVPASQLIFLTKSEHTRLHRLGRHHSEESRKKMSIAKSGEKNPMFGKHETHPMFGTHRSEETRKKISLSQSGEKNPMFGKRGYWSGKHRSEETMKKMSISHSGKHHSEETRKKISMSLSGEKHPMFGRKLRWWNNGTINKRSEKCPGQGWVRGCIKFLRKTK